MQFRTHTHTYAPAAHVSVVLGASLAVMVAVSLVLWLLVAVNVIDSRVLQSGENFETIVNT